MSGSSFRDRVVLITGAASGIGAAVARAFAREAAHLVLTDRRDLPALETLAAELASDARRALPVLCDVHSGDDLARASAAAVAAFGRLDVVVANAGFAVSGMFEELGIDDYRRQFETNVFGVLRTLSATLPALKETKGRIVLLGSVAGFVSLPTDTAYCMSKGAIRGLADGLRAELAPHGVSVTHVVPGFVRTNIFLNDNRGDRVAEPRNPPPDWVTRWLTAHPEPVATRIVEAVRLRRPEVAVPAHAGLALAFQRLFPGLVRRLVAVRMPPRAAPPELHDAPGGVQAFRARYRETLVAPTYSGWLHLALTSGASLAAMTGAALLLDHPTALEWATLPATLLYGNVVEYLGHRHPLHHRTPAFAAVHRKHMEHHRFYTHDAMSGEGSRDFKSILFPWQMTLFFIGAFAVPVAALLLQLASRNVAALFLIAAVGMLLWYEWLHWSCHQPLGHWTHRIPGVAFMRDHHAVHHDPRSMRTWNFNVTFPLLDWLCGTLKPAAAPERAPDLAPAMGQKRFVLVGGYLNELFAGYFRENVHALEELGAGRVETYFPPSRRSLEENVDALLGKLEEWARSDLAHEGRVRPVTLIGHSMGGAGALLLALRNPHLFSAEPGAARPVLEQIVCVHGSLRGSPLAELWCSIRFRPLRWVLSRIPIWRGLQSLRIPGGDDPVRAAVAALAPEDVVKLDERIHYVRGAETISVASPILRIGFQFLKRFGPNDGLMPLERQMLPDLGRDLLPSGALACGHWDPVMPWPISTRPAGFRTALTRALVERLFSKHERKGA
jgi:NAD(P)-dependent dehydrogenase (short-subunit alcohol dehydrogenase family)/pimeloyl-ACP methyl ester carboxylesterase